MVYQCTGIKSKFSYRNKRTGNEEVAIIFNGVRKPVTRDGDFVGLVSENKFISSQNFSVLPKDDVNGGFTVGKYYNFIYESDGFSTYLVKVEQVENF